MPCSFSSVEACGVQVTTQSSGPAATGAGMSQSPVVPNPPPSDSSTISRRQTLPPGLNSSPAASGPGALGGRHCPGLGGIGFTRAAICRYAG